jgi:hypothetical protein
MSREIEVQVDEYGDYFIELPEDILEELSLTEGDAVSWSIQEGDVILTKVDE